MSAPSRSLQKRGKRCTSGLDLSDLRGTVVDLRQVGVFVVLHARGQGRKLDWSGERVSSTEGNDSNGGEKSCCSLSLTLLGGCFSGAERKGHSVQYMDDGIGVEDSDVEVHWDCLRECCTLKLRRNLGILPLWPCRVLRLMVNQRGDEGGYGLCIVLFSVLDGLEVVSVGLCLEVVSVASITVEEDP